MSNFTQSPHDLRLAAKNAKSPQQAADLLRKADNIENQMFNDPTRFKLCEEHRRVLAVTTLRNVAPHQGRMIWDYFRSA